MSFKQREIANFDELVKILKSLTKKSKRVIIGIDGEPGSGKTFISERLKDKLGFYLVSGDDDEFLETQDLSTLLTLDYKKFKKIIRVHKKIIVDSVVLQQLFDKIGMIPNVRIYVKNVDLNNKWIDEEILTESKRTYNDLLSDPSFIPLQKQVIQYHQIFQPHKNAEIIYLNFNPRKPDALNVMKYLKYKVV